ncbi:MAG: formimidoylglutamate deiminase [Actinobacteria bacterium 13_2_20CM_2_72_6]|nr:MAG: formimidoylglutamate deiminase [Actinobacteria bacterium 13_2_20CM_2_72_6]
MPVTRYHAEYAWLGGEDPARDVAIEVDGGVITAVTPSAPKQGTRLPGLTLPGLANVHSHAFHRALRGRTQRGGGTFWTWRERMYEVAEKLDPDSYHRLARAVYGEMALAGITCVGEFHYLHHAPGGARYADPNAMGHALIAAARDAGIRITLLDALYLTSTVDGSPLAGVQRRFGDGSIDGWVDRIDGLRPDAHAAIGFAAHSVRAVPAPALAVLEPGKRPFHVHVSEQRAENDDCQARYGYSPTEFLDRSGLLGPNTTVVHATHLTGEDVRRLGGTSVCFCPTTERDLADGIGPARALVDAGARLALGSDSHAVIDLFEEARAVELNERLRTERRGHFTPGELLAAATAHDALGWTDAGRLAPGYRADLVTVALDSVRTAGAEPLAAAVFAAGAADVTGVIVDGRPVVVDGRHAHLDVARELRESIA